jgi:hypothetical protein
LTRWELIEIFGGWLPGSTIVRSAQTAQATARQKAPQVAELRFPILFQTLSVLIVYCLQRWPAGAIAARETIFRVGGSNRQDSAAGYQ